VKLTTNLYLVLLSRINGALPLYVLHVIVLRDRGRCTSYIQIWNMRKKSVKGLSE
jgi:hypothetical protein